MSKKVIQSINCKEIKNPNEVKPLSYAQCDTLSKDIADYIVEATSKYGGHLSSNLGVVDATISLCRVFDFNKDKIIFDVGHQSYTYKVLTGRSLEHLRAKDGICGFQSMDESPYDHYSAGHSSTSLSAAMGLALARDMKKEKYDIISFIGDSSISNGLAFEALNLIPYYQSKVIIVLNDNDMSISNPVGGMSKVFRRISFNSTYIKFKCGLRRVTKTRSGKAFYTFCYKVKNFIKRRLIKTNIFENLGYDFIGPIDGHDIKEMDAAFKKAKKSLGPVIVLIRTIKGKGYKPSLDDPTGHYHGVGPFEIETGLAKSSSGSTWSDCYAKALDSIMENYKNTYLITPATQIGSSLEDIFNKYPNRCLDVGINEEHAMTMSSGLAVGGYHPIISIYSSFLQRAYDQILHDLARMRCNVTLLIDRAGLVGKDGETHQGIFDESFLYGIPNTVICMASSKKYVNSLLNESMKEHGVFAIRYPRCCTDMTEKDEEIPFGKWNVLKEGKDTALIGLGPNILEVNKLLNDKNVTVIDAIYQKPFDYELLDKIIKDYSKVIIYDAYGVETGFANQLLAYLVKHGFKGEIIAKAVPNTFVTHASIKEQEESFGLLPSDIVKLI